MRIPGLRGRIMYARNAVLLLLSLLAVAVGPSPAAAADATMYELFESMSIVQKDGRTYRQAWAAIKGTARPGTLLCPLPTTCTLNGLGTSSVEVTTGKGTFGGYLTVVVHGDNPVDGPEARVLSGRFSGQMDFSPALALKPPQPYGTVVGTVSIDGMSSPFKGIFHLPFAFPDDPSNTPYYLSFTGLKASGVEPVSAHERALDEPMVKFEICLGSTGC